MLNLTNEILYKITTALDLDNEKIIKIYSIGNYNMLPLHLENLLKKSQDDGFEICNYEELGTFIDALIIFKRGKSSKKRDDEVIELTNNLILKKLRIALELKESEIEIIFGLADIELTKQQLSSLFRNENNKNFKLCSDELLISFLDGLNEFYFVGEIE
ncbi:hypothetical protein MNB_SV-9-626 [hydrothermal vent metagenome]|uniref:DUF1456 domain-containing protein n=1 Tax=hydrothermal vent metagenome TaxID=652676 RepID=A0A1W1C597_9ZZZZ